MYMAGPSKAAHPDTHQRPGINTINHSEEGTPSHQQNAAPTHQQGATLQAFENTVAAQNQGNLSAFALLQEDAKTAIDIARILWEESNMSRD